MGNTSGGAGRLPPRLLELLSKDTGELIGLAESQHLEFKSSARWNVHRGDKDPAIEAIVLKSVAGFMNAKGGVLLIGVDDGGDPVGLDMDYKTLSKTRAPKDSFENWLTTLLANTLGQAATATCAGILFDVIGGRDVCRVEVLPSPEPVFAESKQFFVRMNNSTRELNLRESIDYIHRHWSEAMPAAQTEVIDAVDALGAAIDEQRQIQREPTPAPAPAVPEQGAPSAATKTLERQFHDAMVEVYKRAKREAGYTAMRFIQMVSGDGGLATAKRLIHSDVVSEGFVELWKRGRLDLAVESCVLRPEFEPLFSEEELAIAKERLERYRDKKG